jgi:hypothetical protein
MIYKMLPKLNPDDPQIYACIDDDGLCRLTCTAEHQEFQQYVKNGGELQDADGVKMTAKAVKAFIATLP